MIGHFKYIGLSHKAADLKLRSEVSLNETESTLLIQSLHEMDDMSDLLIVSTCNRTEVYFSSKSDYTNEVVRALLRVKGLEEALQENFTCCSDHNETVRHLFRVALGLEAKVVGDLQIINQVKRAYQLSVDQGVVGPFLHRLLHSVFYTNKRAVQETSFKDGAASVAYAAVELVEEFAGIFRDPRILIIGTGEIGADVARNLRDSDLSLVSIANRTFEKAETLAQELGFKALPLQDAKEDLGSFDIIVSAIPKSEEFYISYDEVKDLEILSFKYFIDLAVPASIDESVEKKNGVNLYNIDQIQNKTQAVIEKRLLAIPDVEKILSESINDLSSWAKEMEVSPTINKLKNALDEIRMEEINRFDARIDDHNSELIETITRNITQKILKLPVVQLKAACKRGEAETLIDVLNDLFDLEKSSVDNTK